MTTISESNKHIAKVIVEAFGGKPRITRYWDDNHASFVDIAICPDRPQPGTSSVSTIGLSDSKLYDNDIEYGTRVELVGTATSTFTELANVVATAAFCIINSRWFCSPGAIFPDIVAMYRQSDTKHLFFTPPFLWEDKLPTLRLPDKTVSWLLCVPISDPEREFAVRNGWDKLEDLFVQRQIDIFDIDRVSEV
jgi:antitoxin YqcF